TTVHMSSQTMADPPTRHADEMSAERPPSCTFRGRSTTVIVQWPAKRPNPKPKPKPKPKPSRSQAEAEDVASRSRGKPRTGTAPGDKPADKDNYEVPLITRRKSAAKMPSDAAMPNPATIQNRTTMLTSLQPASSKWCCNGTIRKTRLPVSLYEPICI